MCQQKHYFPLSPWQLLTQMTLINSFLFILCSLFFRGFLMSQPLRRALKITADSLPRWFESFFLERRLNDGKEQRYCAPLFAQTKKSCLTKPGNQPAFEIQKPLRGKVVHKPRQASVRSEFQMTHSRNQPTPCLPPNRVAVHLYIPPTDRRSDFRDGKGMTLIFPVSYFIPTRPRNGPLLSLFSTASWPVILHMYGFNGPHLEVKDLWKPFSCVLLVPFPDVGYLLPFYSALFLLLFRLIPNFCVSEDLSSRALIFEYFGFRIVVLPPTGNGDRDVILIWLTVNFLFYVNSITRSQSGFSSSIFEYFGFCKSAFVRPLFDLYVLFRSICGIISGLLFGFSKWRNATLPRKKESLLSHKEQ